MKDCHKKKKERDQKNLDRDYQHMALRCIKFAEAGQR